MKNKIIYFLSLFIVISSCGIKTTYNRTKMIKNYESHVNEIEELIRYFDSIIPKDTKLEIEFSNSYMITIFNVEKDDVFKNNWNLRIGDIKTDSIIESYNLKNNDLLMLKLKMDKANCISISNFKEYSIGAFRQDAGKYSYIIHNKPITDSLKLIYKNRCYYKLYNNNIVLEYDNGAIGSICFPD